MAIENSSPRIKESSTKSFVEEKPSSGKDDVRISWEGETDLESLRSRLRNTTWQLEEAMQTIQWMSARAQHADEERRRCLDASRSLRGSVRVMARVRPRLHEEEEEDEGPFLRVLSKTQLEVLTEPRAFLTDQRSRRRTTGGMLPTTNGSRSASTLSDAGRVLGETPGPQRNCSSSAMDSRMFLFDLLFDSNMSDDDVFSSVHEEFIAAVDGEAVCILAYGATGSGKTHTVSNLAERAAKEFERQANSLKKGGLRLELTVQIVEIYNEQLRDLLANDSNHDPPRLKLTMSSSSPGLQGAACKTINTDTEKGIAQSLQEMLRLGQAQRATSSTGVNGRSSRSHLVMTLLLSTCDAATGTYQRTGKLSLVDLAGSERIKRSEAVGERLREAQHINRSLSALADVLWAKERRVGHVPYRNSKLTQLLQDALGGQELCRTVIIVALPPTRSAMNETLHSLQFSTRLSAISLQSSGQRPDGRCRDDDEPGSEAERLRAENEKIRVQLEEKDKQLKERSREVKEKDRVIKAQQQMLTKLRSESEPPARTSLLSSFGRRPLHTHGAGDLLGEVQPDNDSDMAEGIHPHLEETPSLGSLVCTSTQNSENERSCGASITSRRPSAQQVARRVLSSGKGTSLKPRPSQSAREGQATRSTFADALVQSDSSKNAARHGGGRRCVGLSSTQPVFPCGQSLAEVSAIQSQLARAESIVSRTDGACSGGSCLESTGDAGRCSKPSSVTVDAATNGGARISGSTLGDLLAAAEERVAAASCWQWKEGSSRVGVPTPARAHVGQDHQIISSNTSQASSANGKALSSSQRTTRPWESSLEIDSTFESSAEGSFVACSKNRAPTSVNPADRPQDTNSPHQKQPLERGNSREMQVSSLAPSLPSNSSSLASGSVMEAIANHTPNGVMVRHSDHEGHRSRVSMASSPEASSQACKTTAPASTPSAPFKGCDQWRPRQDVGIFEWISARGCGNTPPSRDVDDVDDALRGTSSRTPPKPEWPGLEAGVHRSPHPHHPSAASSAWPVHDTSMSPPPVVQHQQQNRARSGSGGRKGTPREYTVEVISPQRARELTRGPLPPPIDDSPRHAQTPQSPALLLCPSGEDGCYELMQKNAGIVSIPRSDSSISQSSDEGTIKNRLQQDLMIDRRDASNASNVLANAPGSPAYTGSPGRTVPSALSAAAHSTAPSSGWTALSVPPLPQFNCMSGGRTPPHPSTSYPLRHGAPYPEMGTNKAHPASYTPHSVFAAAPWPKAHMAKTAAPPPSLLSATPPNRGPSFSCSPRLQYAQSASGVAQGSMSSSCRATVATSSSAGPPQTPRSPVGRQYAPLVSLVSMGPQGPRHGVR